jgi:hypothetical protein
MDPGLRRDDGEVWVIDVASLLAMTDLNEWAV